MARRTPPTEGFTLHAHVGIVETADALLLQELRADPATGTLILAQLSDCLAVIAPGKEEVLVRQLLKNGHMPGVSEG